MNGRSCKLLRKLFNPAEGDAISKKSYRVAKKHFQKLDDKEKVEFIKNLETIHNSQL